VRYTRETVSEKEKQSIAAPTKWSWTKNTYFWIALILFALGALGVVKGGDFIRDPGQLQKVDIDLFGSTLRTTNDHLTLIYFVSAAVMLVNGLVSHKLWLKQFEEEK
jgi:hypothetical protein